MVMVESFVTVEVNIFVGQVYRIGNVGQKLGVSIVSILKFK